MKLTADLILSGLQTEDYRGIKTSALSRSVFAHMMRIVAFNPDFNEYVKVALDLHKLPPDPKMDWAKWLERVYYKINPQNEELRDEAIHEVLIHNLFDEKADILAKFDSSRLPEKIQQRPLAEQVSSYLKICFSYMVGDARKYLKKIYPNQERAMDLGKENENEPIDLLNRIEHGVTDPEVELLEHNVEVRKLRHAFQGWCKRKLRPAEQRRMLILFDLVTTFDGPQGELIEEFAKRVGVTFAAARQLLYRELPKHLRQFANSDEGKGFSLTKRIRTKIDQKRPQLENAEKESAIF